jgi:hypothetical protein
MDGLLVFSLVSLLGATVGPSFVGLCVGAVAGAPEGFLLVVQLVALELRLEQRWDFGKTHLLGYRRCLVVIIALPETRLGKYRMAGDYVLRCSCLAHVPFNVVVAAPKLVLAYSMIRQVATWSRYSSHQIDCVMGDPKAGACIQYW